MCNGTSTRVAQGGTIVVLKPTSPQTSSSSSSSLSSSSNTNPTLRPRLEREISLRLVSSYSSSPSSSTTTEDERHTTATIEGLENFLSPSMKESWFVIHKTGDLRPISQTSPSISEEESNILHRFSLPRHTRDQIPFQLEGKSLDLSVGGEGIIGRRVSFIQGGRVLGEGIMGWN